MNHHFKTLLSEFIILLGLFTTITLGFSNTATAKDSPKKGKIPVYSYRIVQSYPHDRKAYTQGLVFENGVLYEGTGRYGRSEVRMMALPNGSILMRKKLPPRFFGEGITIFEDKIIQLTWRKNKGFVYDKHSFNLLQEFDYLTEGWGITHDGNRLVMSDGTATLYFLDPETYEVVGQIEVYGDGPVTRLNELEYVKGQIYANIWQEDKIVIINHHTGQVTGWINMTDIQDLNDQVTSDVLNGIAYDSEEDRLFVTGKKWSKLYEIKLIPLE